MDRYQKKYMPNNLARLHPVILVLLIILIVFLALTRWIEGGDPINPETGLRSWIEVLLLTLASILSLIINNSKNVFLSLKDSRFILLYIFSFWCFITTFWSADPVTTLGKSLEMIMLIFITSFLTDYIRSNGIKIESILITAILLIILFLFVINLFSYHSLFPTRLLNGRNRFFLGYEHPNNTAILISILAILLFSGSILSSKKIYRILYIALFLVSVILVFLTDSRTSLFSLVISISIFVYLKLRNKIKKIENYVILILPVATLGLVLLGTFDNTVKEILKNNPDLLTLNGRLGLWGSVFQTYNANLLGVGYMSSRVLILDQLGIDWGYSLHNSFLEILFTTGWVGLVIAVIFLLQKSISVVLRISITPLPFVILIFILIESIMENRLLTPSIIFFLFLLISSNIFENQQAEQKSSLL